ncbi:glycosyltransferase [Pimelobacter simplex]|uniref:glycosyltransferase n=1 Tax=Nocardioides simplex TaxID=2045 RepID=UPI003AAF171D
MSRRALRRLRSVLQGHGHEADARARVVFLVAAVHGRSGVARAVVNIAGALVATHRVEIVSVYDGGRHAFAIDPRIPVRHLVPVAHRRIDELPRGQREEARTKSAYVGDPYFSRLTDAALARELGRLGPGDVLISTRPSLHRLATALTAPDVVRVAWDHFNYPGRQRRGGGMGVIRQAMAALAAFVVLTEADRRDYLRDFPEARIEVIRNAIPWPTVPERVARDSRTVVAAGRLAPVKGFDRLIDAWAVLAPEFPDWRCRILGLGPQQDELQARIDATGVRTIELAGNSDDMPAELRAAEIFAMSSHLEGLPMTIIEALSQGTPVVTFDCPRGPGELVNDANGRLVPDGDVPALTAALRELMQSKELRDELGEQALRDSRQYDIDHVAEVWRRLLADLAG